MSSALLRHGHVYTERLLNMGPSKLLPEPTGNQTGNHLEPTEDQSETGPDAPGRFSGWFPIGSRWFPVGSDKGPVGPNNVELISHFSVSRRLPTSIRMLLKYPHCPLNLFRAICELVPPTVLHP